MQNLIEHLNRIYLLMTNYGVALTSNDYCHPDRRRKALRTFCSSSLTEKDPKDEQEKEKDKKDVVDVDVVDYTRLNRVAHLLSLRECYALQEQALAASNVDARTQVMVTCAQRLLLCNNGLHAILIHFLQFTQLLNFVILYLSNKIKGKLTICLGICYIIKAQLLMYYLIISPFFVILHRLI